MGARSAMYVHALTPTQVFAYVLLLSGYFSLSPSRANDVGVYIQGDSEATPFILIANPLCELKSYFISNFLI